MKIAKRILAIAMTVFMIVGTCAIAASAAGSVQAAIDAADGSYTLTSNVTESIVINKDFVLDLGGHSIQGERGKVAITINNANVTIINGRVVSRFADVSSAEMIKTVKNQSPAAIRVNGGSLTVTGVSVSGGMTRIPTQTKYSVVTGSAIEAVNGATIMLNQATLAGRYGVNNATGGKVYVNDAVILGFIRGIRANEVVSEDTVKVNAADHINGIFNNGKKLTAREIGLIKTILGERANVYTKKVYSNAVVTITEGSATATVTASVDDTNIWENRYSTACSYKYIPEYAVLSDGTKVAMTSEDGVNYTASVSAALAKEGVQVKYRMWAELQNDIAKYATNFRAYLNRAYEIALDKLDYAWACSKFDQVMDMICDLWTTIDELPNPENNGEIGFAIADSAEFKSLQKALFDLGGAIMLNGNQDYPLNPAKGKYYIGYGQRVKFTGSGDEKSAYAPLDSICQIKDDFDAKFGVLNDDSKWGDIAAWAYDVIFRDGGLIDIAFETKDALDALLAVLEDGNVAKLVEMAGYTDKVAKLQEVAEMADAAVAVYNRVMASGTVQDLLAKAEANKNEIKPYVDKAVYVYHNLDQYVTPENFVKNNNLMCWSATADATIETVDAPVKVDAAVVGEGIVVCGENATTDEMTATHDGTVTLEAQPMGDCEFLYWTNNAGNIISTEPDITLVTKINRELTAHFGYLDEPTVTFASSIGNVVAEKSYVPGNGDVISTGDIDAVQMPGMIFESWPGASGGSIDMDALTVSYDYVGGANSAFAVSGTSYSNAGHVLAYRPGSKALILIPSFDSENVCTLTYIDNGTEQTVNAKIGQTVTITASGDNFAYWMDGDGHIVGVNATYSHQVVRSAEFVAVYGDETPDCAINIVAEKDDAAAGKTTYYAQRTVKNGLKLLSSGVIIAPAGVAEEDIVVNSTNPAVKKGISRNTANDGMYAVTLTRATYPVAILRPFVEIEGIGVVYGECYAVGAVG